MEYITNTQVRKFFLSIDPPKTCFANASEFETQMLRFYGLQNAAVETASTRVHELKNLVRSKNYGKISAYINEVRGRLKFRNSKTKIQKILSLYNNVGGCIGRSPGIAEIGI